MCKECVKGVLRVCEGCWKVGKKGRSKQVLKKYQGCFKVVSRVSVCFRVISAVIDLDRYK